MTLACLAAMVGLASPLLRDTEPRYRDASLSEWLALHKAYKFQSLLGLFRSTPFQGIPDADARGAEAPEAIRCIGTNAIPCLIKWMSVPRSSWKTLFAKSIAKLPRAVRPSKLPAWLTPSKDYELASLAYNGFVILGPAATPAIPDLVKVACNSRALSAASAVHVLVGLKKPAVPALASILTNNHPKDVQKRVMQGLGYLGTDAGEAIPALVSSLKKPDEELAAISAATLARIRQRPDLAVPPLIACLEDSRHLVRLAAAKALADFGSDALPAVAKLQDLLAKPDISLSQEAERTLLKIAPPMLLDPAAGEPFPLLDSFSTHH